MRLSKPQGFLLLYFPCLFGYYSAGGTDITITIKFLICSILMRGFGCIINDLADIDFDKHVERTKKRALTSGKVSVRTAFIIACFLAIISFAIALTFLTKNALITAISSLLLVVLYPFCKRFTYFPQVILGFTFNIGVLVGWQIVKAIDFNVLILYLATVFWTLGYDTVYAMSDVKDDLRIGIKSTAIFFGANTDKFVLVCYLVFTLGLSIFTILNNGLYLAQALIIVIAGIFVRQYTLLKKQPNYQTLFIQNAVVGLFVALINLLN